MKDKTQEELLAELGTQVLRVEMARFIEENREEILRRVEAKITELASKVTEDDAQVP